MVAAIAVRPSGRHVLWINFLISQRAETCMRSGVRACTRWPVGGGDGRAVRIAASTSLAHPARPYPGLRSTCVERRSPTWCGVPSSPHATHLITSPHHTITPAGRLAPIQPTPYHQASEERSLVAGVARGECQCVLYHCVAGGVVDVWCHHVALLDVDKVYLVRDSAP